MKMYDIYQRKGNKKHSIGMKGIDSNISLNKKNSYSGISIELDDKELFYLTTNLLSYCLSKRKVKKMLKENGWVR